MHKLAKAGIMREVKDYAYITLGLISYSLGWAAFLLPYQITTGGTTGISAIIYYSTGFPIQWSYFIIGVVLDWIINSARQSVQFFIFSKKYDEIADRIIKDADRGVTVLDGTGWYSKANVKVLVVLAKKRQSLDIFRLVKRIDPNAFISQSSVIGVYGEGFEKLKVK